MIVHQPVVGCFAEFKENFLRIKHLILIGGPDDEVITPWQSRLVQLLDWLMGLIGGRLNGWLVEWVLGWLVSVLCAGCLLIGLSDKIACWL